MVCSVIGGNIHGLLASLVNVEVDIGNGLPGIDMGGVLSAEVREAKERVRVAIKNAGYDIKPRRITINLSPADVRKSGTGFDLPIAVGVLTAEGFAAAELLKNTMFIGELSLDGTVRGVRGVLPCVCEAARQGLRYCVIPQENAMEGAAVKGITVYTVQTLQEAVDYLNHTAKVHKVCGQYGGKRGGGQPPISRKTGELQEKHLQKGQLQEEQLRDDYGEIFGQEAAKRATLIAAAGMHNIVYVGTPGSGKTMLAKRIPSILPELDYEECLEVSKIYSVAGLLGDNQGLITQRPFRSPHHIVTLQAMIGGGRIPAPGEITLANKGVLFLDEFTEFDSAVVEALRQPLEDGRVTIVRNRYSYTYPAEFMLVAAMNPCKCGYYPDRNKCHCTDADIARYMGRISTPIWDRFDLCVSVVPVGVETLLNHGQNQKGNGEMTSQQMKEQILQAHRFRQQRIADEEKKLNKDFIKQTKGKINTGEAHSLGKEEQNMMEQVLSKKKITARGYYKILRVARTIADLEQSETITCSHLAEAVSYRSFER